MTRLPLPAPPPSSPVTPEALFERLRVTDPRLQNLWSQQADVLRGYAEAHTSSPDVALELPTGAGKTLVGLLIAEWRRLKLGHRVAFVCATNQLASQVHEKASGYGIETALLIGASEDWPGGERERVAAGRAVAVTNYHHIFNRTPRIAPQTLLFDDAHTAEGPVAERWSLRISRAREAQLFAGVLAAVAPELPEHHARALATEELSPAHRRKMHVLLPDATTRCAERMRPIKALM